jgi:hypothetical protein
MQRKNSLCFLLTILTVNLFLTGSSLQAQTNGKTVIPFHAASLEKGRDIKMAPSFQRGGKTMEFEQPFQRAARPKEILSTLSKRSAGQAIQKKLNGQIFLLDTAIAYTIQDTARYSFSYSANGWYSSYVYELWTNGQWVNSYRGSFTYDANRLLLSEIYENSTTGQWENSSRYTYTYDAKGNMLSSLDERWTAGQWVNDYHYTATYDASGNQLSYLAEQWVSGQWVNLYRFTDTYDAKGNQLTYLSEQWTNGQWLSSSRGTGAYNTNGMDSSWLSQQWVNGQWENSYRYTYAYDRNGNELSEIDEQWTNGQWANSGRTTYTYDASGRELSELDEQWTNGLWVNSYRTTYTYNANGNAALFIAEQWTNSLWQPFNSSSSTLDSAGNYIGISGCKIIFHYKQTLITAVKEEIGTPSSHQLFQNYPNPFNPSTVIKYRLSTAGNVRITIFDLLGREVITLLNKQKPAGSYQMNWNASGIPSGVYFYRLQAGSFIETKKLILLK